MFCPKCGTQLDEGSYQCPSCGWVWQEAENEPIRLNEENNLTIIKKELMDADNSDNSPSHIKFNSKKIKIICLITLVFVVSIIIGLTIYLNSDSYKIKIASKLIVSGQYSDGVNKINNIYTPQAMATKNFVKVENARQTFVKSIENDSISDAWATYDKFKTTLNKFDEENEIYYLTDSLKKNYDCYRTAFDYIAEYTEISEDSSNEMVQALYDIQEVMMNEVDKNKSSRGGKSFTLNKLQSRVNTSKYALQILEDYDFSCIEVSDSNVKLYCHTDTSYSNGEEKAVVFTSKVLSETVDSLINECESEIESSQYSIKTASEKFQMDEDLYLTNTIDDYSSYVGVNLENISDYGNIASNRETILKTLRKDMLYFLIVGSTAD